MIPQQFDQVFQTKVSSFLPFKTGYSPFFTNQEIEALKKSDQKFNPENRTIVLLSFENDYASLGGLAVVTRYLPRMLRRAGENIVFMTPYHANNLAIKKAKDKESFSQRCVLKVDCGGQLKRVTCFEDTTADFPSYFIQVQDFFEAEQDPYHYSDSVNLLLDSLAFCNVLPAVCARLGLVKDIVFHGHDWETAAIAYTSKKAVLSKVLTSAKTLLTLHNSYDSPLPGAVAAAFYKKAIPVHTVLQAFIPLMNGPLTTVSAPFAHELRNDPLQVGHFTGHLQDVFSQNPPIGIENGVFCDHLPLVVSGKKSAAKKVSSASIMKQKNDSYKEMLRVFADYHEDSFIGKLTFSKKEPSVPVFFVSGRLDLMQKGFDSIFWAFERLKRGSAKLLFSPTLSGGSSAGLSFFSDMALRCLGDIAVWPVRIPQAEYGAILRGAGYMIMPSFYEPFGSATEALGCGTPVIARATGGLWVQVDSYNDITVPQFYGPLLAQSGHTSPLQATGILYREKYPESLSADEWNRIFALPLDKRIRSPLFESIVEAAHDALLSAIGIYSDKEKYATLVANSSHSVSGFGWDKAVAKYKKVYDACAKKMV